VARPPVADAVEDAVTLVTAFAADVALRGEVVAATDLDLEVDVRRPPGVGHRFDGAEIVFAARGGQKAAEALEVGVAIAAVIAARMQVGAAAVHLPDLDGGVADGIAATV